VARARPALPRTTAGGHSQMLFMLPMMLGMGAMAFFYIGRQSGPMLWMFAALYGAMIIGMITMSITRGQGMRKAQINDERRDYLRYLASLRRQGREVAGRPRAALLASP